MTSPGKDEDPSIVRASDGTFHLAFYANRDGADRLWIATSSDGLAWGAPRPVTATAEHAFYPCLLQTEDGRFHLTWWAGELGDGGKIVGRIRYASSSDTQAWDGPASLTDAAGLAWGATIVEGVPGSMHAVWSSDAAGDKDLYTASSTNGGASWSAPVRRIDPAFNDDLPFVAAKADGSLIMVWQRFDPNATAFEDYATHPTNELAYATSTDGTTWTTPIALTADPAGASVPDVLPALMPSPDPTGFSVLWSSIRLGAQEGNVYVMPLSTGPAVNGSALGPAIVQITPDGGYGGRVAVIGQGSQLRPSGSSATPCMPFPPMMKRRRSDPRTSAPVPFPPACETSPDPAG
jgi:hypothetical protein